MKETPEAKLARDDGEFIDRHKARGAELAGFRDLYEASLACEVEVARRARLHVVASERTNETLSEVVR